MGCLQVVRILQARELLIHLKTPIRQLKVAKWHSLLRNQLFNRRKMQKFWAQKTKKKSQSIKELEALTAAAVTNHQLDLVRISMTTSTMKYLQTGVPKIQLIRKSKRCAGKKESRRSTVINRQNLWSKKKSRKENLTGSSDKNSRTLSTKASIALTSWTKDNSIPQQGSKMQRK